MKTIKEQQAHYIQQLKDSVSWADEIFTITLKSDEEEAVFAYTDCMYYVPIHWEHYLGLEFSYYCNPAVTMGTVEIRHESEGGESESLELPTCFLIGGDPPKEVATHITSNWLANKPKCRFHLHFVDAIARIYYSRALMTRLDGVDWGRTLSGYAENGREGQLVMEWD